MMKRLNLFTVELETNVNVARMVEIFDHRPTMDSIRTALAMCGQVVDDEAEAHKPSDDSSDDEVHEARISGLRDELARLEELICVIKPVSLENAIDTGFETIFVAGARVGGIRVTKSSYLAMEKPDACDSKIGLSQSVGVVVERRGPRTEPIATGCMHGGNGLSDGP